MSNLHTTGPICANAYGSMFERFAKYYHPVSVRHLDYQDYFWHECHLHDFPQVWYCVKGTYTHAIADEDFDCGPGSVIIIPPGVPHSYETSETDSVELFCIEGTFFFFDKMKKDARINTITNMFCAQFGNELGFTPPRFVVLSKEEKSQADELLLSLCKNDYKRNIANIQNIYKEIGNFFSLPSLALSMPQQERAEVFIRNKLSPMMKAIAYINKNYPKKIHKEELVRISTLCQTDFFRYIKKIVGTTYALYLQIIRLRRAQIMISFSTFSFSYIADNCGFGNWRYLSKLFHQHFKITMQEERKNQASLIKRFPYMVMTHNFWDKNNLE